jgi:lia operon protein LiaG
MALVIAVLLLGAVAAPALAGFTEERSFTSSELVVHNLIGEITVTGGSGSFEVKVNVQGSDASRDSIEILAKNGRESMLTVAFPKGQSRFVYPRLGAGSSTSFSADKGDSSWISSILGALGNKRIKVSGSGSGMEVWADIEISVPNGASLRVMHGVGEIHATNLDGEIYLSTHSGAINATGVNGQLTADTGSGKVRVDDVRGDLLVDTGSGSVTASNCEGDSVNIDTGSGSVTAEAIIARKLRIDTGSGRVRARSVEADSAVIDTGSGSVVLELDRMGTGSFRIDTGSGSVKLQLPTDASARVVADTGSGGVHLDLTSSDVKIHHKERNEAEFTIGAGAARISLDTGSGSITISN